MIILIISYQVQLQMKICQVQYCDFVVWKKADVFVQRILVDIEFIDDAIKNVKSFIKLAILPELVGKWFTKQSVVPLSEATKDHLNPNNEACSSTSAAEV